MDNAMSLFFEPKFTPAMIEDILSAAPTLLRNWRTRGHLDHIGELQGGGRWLYNGSDLTKMALVLILQEDRVDLSDAFHFAEEIEVDVLIQLFDLEGDGIGARFTMLFRTHEAGNWFPYRVHVAEHLDVNSPVTTVLDARAFARKIPDSLKDVLPVPTTDDLQEIWAEKLYLHRPQTMYKATGKMDVPEAGDS